MSWFRALWNAGGRAAANNAGEENPASGESPRILRIIGATVLIGGGLYVAGSVIGRIRTRLSGESGASRSATENSESVQQVQQSAVIQQEQQQSIQQQQQQQQSKWRTTMLDLMLVIFVLVFVILVMIQEKVVLVAAPGLFLFLRYLLYMSPIEPVSSLDVSPYGPRPPAGQSAPSVLPIGKVPRLPGEEKFEEKEDLSVEVPNEARSQWEFPQEVKSNPQFSVIPYKFEYVFKAPIGNVLAAVKTRYPDPKKPAVILTKIRDDESEVVLSSGEKVKSRFVHLETKHPAQVPQFLKSIIGQVGDSFRLDDKMIEFPQKKYCRVQTVNRDFRHVVIVMVMSEYRVHSKEHSDWTILEQTAAIQFISGGFFKGQLQVFAEKTFKTESLDQAKRLDEIIKEKAGA